MADREKVIKALELCACDGEMHCKECPYDFEPSIKCVMLMHTDALTLLESQKYHTVTIGFNPDVDEYVKKVANLALDVFVYQGKTIREWVETLMAQEPRMLTLEEVAGRVALERETPIYMEFGYMSTHAGQVIGLNPKYMYFDDENGLSWDVCEGPDRGKKDGVSLDEYNDIWRCWSSRPTDEQREATPWDD